MPFSIHCILLSLILNLAFITFWTFLYWTSRLCIKVINFRSTRPLWPPTYDPWHQALCTKEPWEDSSISISNNNCKSRTCSSTSFKISGSRSENMFLKKNKFSSLRLKRWIPHWSVGLARLRSWYIELIWLSAHILYDQIIWTKYFCRLSVNQNNQTYDCCKIIDR